MDIYLIRTYREIIKTRLEMRVKRGYGQLSKLAKHLGVNSTFISQVMAETKDLNLEQAALASEFLGLSEAEEEYFIITVQHARAGTQRLKRILEKQMDRIRSQHTQVASKLNVTRVLDDAQKSLFYSDWVYSAVRQLTAIDQFHSSDRIAERLKISDMQVSEVLRFLVAAGLCEERKGAYYVGPARTHLDPKSPWIKAHHQNWRIKALEKVQDLNENKLHYTSPMTIATKDVPVIRQALVDAIEKVGKIVDQSSSEELHCINIDWFRV